MPEETAKQTIQNNLSNPSGEEGTTPSDSQQVEAPSPAQEPEPSTEVSETEATSQPSQETETVSEDDQESPELSEQEKEFFFKAPEDHPYDTQYETPEDAKQGIKEKDKYVHKLEQELEQLEEQYESQINDYESQVSEYEAQVQQWTQGLDEEQFKQRMVQDIMREKDEELAQANPDELEPDEQKRYWRLYGAAEDQYDKEQQEAQQSLQEQRQQKRDQQKDAMQRRQEAIDTVSNRVENEFTIRNPEDKQRINDKLSEPVAELDGQEVSAQDLLVLNQESFGDKATELMLKGLKSEIEGNTQKQVQETVEKTKTTPEQPTPPPKSNTPPRSSREKISAGLGNV